MAYRFKCKKCNHEYTHNTEHQRKCPMCGQWNQNNGKYPY